MFIKDTTGFEPATDRSAVDCSTTELRVQTFFFLINKDEIFFDLFSPPGNWTPVYRVTGGDTSHYTIGE